ncbi:F-box/kelch-repeat protein At3g23880-like [Actinidia eriantha]|uniref:F-box/kelch-repeat protein At3g23880-like n=1 Tax=Actinidia eriantha TaxID=165200 RepID=UPI00258658A4|nr:F-box/kelch-repeat protein At3g23880-like [Actinidia eriantha]
MSECLPVEVVIEILKRLPVKSLLQFRCVCKTWRSLITSPNFITMHLNQTLSDPKNRNIRTLLRHYSKDQGKEIYSLHSDNETFDENNEGIEFPFAKQTKFYWRVVGSCNGLLCLSDDLFYYMDSIILWNPMIRRSLTLPVPCFTLDSYGPSMFALGFGVDPKTKDHKVVRLAYAQGDDGFEVPPVVEIFSLHLGSWRGIHSAVSYNITEHFWSQALINGVVHWVAYHLSKKNGARTFRSLIMSFDLGSEEFGELKLPESLVGASPINMSAAVFGGSLTILQYDSQIWASSCSIWVMKEYGIVESWSNQFNIDLGGGVVLGVRGNGELLLSTSSGDLVSYNCGAEACLSIGKCGTKDSFYAGSYTESLILLTEGNKGLGREASMVSSASSSADEESGGEDEGENFVVESNELWVKLVIIQCTNALLSQL